MLLNYLNGEVSGTLRLANIDAREVTCIMHFNVTFFIIIEHCDLNLLKFPLVVRFPPCKPKSIKENILK